MPELDPSKLKENALTSIRLGIEDFQKSQAAPNTGGDAARALSAVRNLFSGVLLLFKYKIATSVDDLEQAAQLIFNPPEVLPHADGDGGIEWKPVGKFRRTTIDVPTIKQRFEGFNIEVDWGAINKLQECRNHLEHLHPANTLGEVADFVAELFPVLRDFVQTQLGCQPAELLGPAWTIMLEHHTFFVATSADCKAAWEGTRVPELMLPWLAASTCENCGSSLLRPHQEELDENASVELDEHSFRYVCLACGHAAPIVPVMLRKLEDAYDSDLRDGGEPGVETCMACGHETFVVDEQQCLWCRTELDYSKCELCEEPLRQDDQDNGGLCGYHAHAREKWMRDD